ncbi:MAG: polysaccharide-degrading enzyme [Verrucomicrobia bacterium]|nr:polysaccharide-degrading enzyme [Verrucomicrobiota bacterium]
MKSRVLSVALLVLAGGAFAATYEVGPGKQLADPGQVPWESLSPGDTVLIYPRPEPYRSKFVLCRAGRADAPITVRGVPDAAGRLPVLAGAGATTRRSLQYWGGERSIIKIGGAKNPPDTTPAYIVIENLEIGGARTAQQFTEADGKAHKYLKNAAAIRVEKGEHLIIRNCILRDCGNGLFISSSDKQATRDVLVEGNRIFDNGNPGSGYEHNVYSEAIGLVFQFNRLGPLLARARGNNLKDRSAGLVVRYNWIEGGDKQLDLVDAEDSKLVRLDARYHEAFVYGNTLLKLPTDGHGFVVHCGGDGAIKGNYRQGLLHFFNNTVVSLRKGTTVLFRFSSDAERVELRNNIFHTAAPKGKIAVVENTGRVDMTRNWFTAGWEHAADPRSTPRFNVAALVLTGRDPGFVNLAAQDLIRPVAARARRRRLTGSICSISSPRRAPTKAATSGLIPARAR